MNKPHALPSDKVAPMENPSRYGWGLWCLHCGLKRLFTTDLSLACLACGHVNLFCARCHTENAVKGWGNISYERCPSVSCRRASPATPQRWVLLCKNCGAARDYRGNMPLRCPRCSYISVCCLGCNSPAAVRGMADVGSLACPVHDDPSPHAIEEPKGAALCANGCGLVMSREAWRYFWECPKCGAEQPPF